MIQLQVHQKFLLDHWADGFASVVSIRRKALSPYTLSDGTLVPTGSWACVPQRAILRAPMYYSDPNVFNGFRFAIEGAAEKHCLKPGPLTDIDATFPLWGLGKRAW